MAQDKEDLEMLIAYLEGRLNSVAVALIVARLNSEPTLKDEFEKLAETDLAAFIRQRERIAFKSKLKGMRVELDVEFDEIIASTAQLKESSGINLSKQSNLINHNSSKEPEFIRNKYQKRINFYYSIAAVFAVVAFIGGLGFWFFYDNGTKPKLANTGENEDSSYVVNNNEIVNIESDTTIQNKKVKGLETDTSIVFNKSIIYKIRRINRNSLGFGLKSKGEDSLIIDLRASPDSQFYLHDDKEVIFWSNIKEWSLFKDLSSNNFLRVSGSSVLEDGLYLKFNRKYYLLNKAKNKQLLSNTFINDRLENQELKEIFSK